MSITDSDTIAAGKAWLLAKLDKGASCPLCHQMAKTYKRKVNSTMARSLITLWREAGYTFTHGPSLSGDTHEISQLSWWGLIEEEIKLRPDGGRAGYWRITDRGYRFIYQQLTIPKYVKIYDGTVQGFELPYVDITQALGTKFSYSDLMAGV